jgi:mono/diheme cytochrome c family protein
MKKTITLLSTFMLVAILAACGGSAPASTADLEPAAPAQAESTPTETPATTEETVSATEEPAAAESEASSAAVSYANDVSLILEAKCIKCHGIESKKEGLDMLTYDNLMKGSRNGAVVVPGDANNSLLVQLIVEGEMPNRGAKVTPEELQLIIDWVNQGALNN